MLGQVVYQRDGKGTKVVRAPLHGVPVLRVALDPEGFWARRRAGRAARRLVRQGAARVLVPEDFPFWEELSRAGLRPVDPLPLLRSCAAPMALALLRRQGEDPLRAAVALRGSRAERDLVRAAEELCPRVRDLCLSVQTGGGELERYLHRQYGVALRPDWAGVQGGHPLRSPGGGGGAGGPLPVWAGSGSGGAGGVGPRLRAAEGGPVAAPAGDPVGDRASGAH